MMLREYWANVYVTDGAAHIGALFRTRSYCDYIGTRSPIRERMVARIRVRLKPEGAPARYSSEHDRRNWEQYPEEMRKCPF